jgi:hypothetical protein
MASAALKEPEGLPETGQDTGTGEPQSGGEQQTKSAEDEAYLRGWRPKEEFTGRGEWVDAETFLAKADTNLGLSKAEREQLKRRISVLEGMNKKLIRLEQNAYSSAMADIQAKMKNAVVTGNVAEFEALDKKAEKLREDAAAPQADQQKEAIRAFADWRDDNEWYDLGGLPSATETERKQRVYFDRMVEANEDKAREMAPADFIAYIGDLVESKYPAASTPRPKATESVAGVTRGGTRTAAKTYANMPPEFQRQADRFHEKGVYKGTLAEAREKYAKAYFAKEL